jgi:outer membrane lipoprotein-sorting protein
MRTIFAGLVCSIWLSAVMLAQQPAAPPSTTPASQGESLESVLNRMDATATGFRSAQANFQWVLYEKVVDSTDTQDGKIYFRRSGKQIEMAADIIQPESEKKYVLYDDSMLRVYQPRIDQVTEYNTGKNRAEVESFLVIGFGGRGHDLLKSFDVTYDGMDEAMGVKAAKLNLVPKTQKGKNIFSHILLWIDPARGISVQQQFFEPDGNYRLAKYSNIDVNQKIPEDVFKLKTTGRTKVVNPQGGL